MDDLREVIARGFHEHLSRRDVMQYLDNEEDCDGLADAALAAIKEAGFVVVPAEPTEAMVEAGAKDFGGDLVTTRGASDIYRAMIEAAST
jgi:hypothetical protein